MPSETRDPTSVDKAISRRVRQRREQLGLSQPDLAGSLGITFQQVQKYESGRNRISAGRLYEIARTLKTSLLYFFEGGEPEPATSRRAFQEDQANFEGPAAKDEVDLTNAFRQIQDPNLRKSIVADVRRQARLGGKPQKRTR